MSKQAVVGILAHVDAGKTTLAEAMLFDAGRIRKRGRVDDGDSHLDTNEIERERGITIFSSQAVLDHGDTHVMLVDAPGHVDFFCGSVEKVGVEPHPKRVGPAS